MLRTALKPRWVGLFALMVLAVLLCWRLGLWQLHVAQDKGEGGTPVSTAAPLTAVVSPHQPFPSDGSGRVVTMQGSYAAERQVLVAGRRLGGDDGFWVVDPLTVAPPPGQAGSVGVLAVVRGFVRTPAEAPAPPTGTVAVQGSLAPGETPATGPAPPAGQIGALDLSVLVNQWSGDLYNAFVFATGEQAGDGPVALGGLTRVPPPSPTGGGGLQWRNAAYALQWWIFALFAAWMWFKMVRDDWLTGQAVRAATREDALAEQEKDTSDATP